MNSQNDPQPSKPRLKVRDPAAPAKPVDKVSSNKPGKDSSGSASGKGWRRRVVEKVNLLEGSARLLLGVGVLISPWAFGSVSAMTQAIWCLVALVCLMLWLIRRFTEKSQHRHHTSLVLVLLFLAIGVFQLVNLPEVVHPYTVKKQNEIRSNLATALEVNHPETAERIKAQSQVALNLPAAEYQYCYFVLLGATVFLGSRFFNRRQDLLSLATFVGMNGASIAIFGAFQKVVSSSSVLGWELEFGGMPFGPFVNRNNAAGYLLICLGCSLAVLIYSFSQVKISEESKKSGLEKEGTLSSFAKELRVLLANLTVSRIFLLAMCGVIAAGVALSLSRGGMISMALAFLVLMLMLFRYKKNRALILLLFFFVPIGVGTIVWTGLQSTVNERLQTLNQEDVLTDSDRARLWSDSIRAVNDYPAIGSGAGSFPYVYREYQTYPDKVWFFHAENVPLEILITTGLLGLGVGIVFLAFLVKATIAFPKNKNSERKASPKSTAIGVLLFFVLTSQLISNFFDFGFLIPSNGLLLALLVGATLGIVSAQVVNEKSKDTARFALLPTWGDFPIIAVLVLTTTWASYSLFQTAKIEKANLQARTNAPEDLTREEISKALNELESVTEIKANLEAHQFLAQLHVLNLHHEFADHQFENRPDSVALTRQEMFDRVALRIINFDLALAPALQQANIANLQKLEFFPFHLEAATTHYLKALEICPLHAPAIVGLAELALLNDQDVAPYITAFEELNVRNAELYLRMGDVAVSHNLKKIGFRYWRRSIELDEKNAQIVVPSAALFFDFEQITQDLLPDNAEILDQIAEKFLQGENMAEPREMVYRRMNELLTRTVRTDAEGNYLLGKACVEIGDIPGAIASYEMATRMSPLNYKWKAGLARLYLMVGELEKALEEIEKCTTAEPGNNDFKKLAAEINKALE